MSALDRLIALEEIRQLKADYFLCVDGKRWDDLRELFTPDATTDTQGQGCLRDREGFVAAVSRLFADAVTFHTGAMPRIVLHSAQAASGIWTMQDRLWFAQKHEAGDSWRYWHGVGRYHEDYQRVDGRWRIRTLRLERVDPAPVQR